MNLSSDHPDLAPPIDPDGIQSRERDVTDIDDSSLRQLYEHWDSARGKHLWLKQEDFRPELCPLVLPHLSVIESRPDSCPSLHIRLMGEEIANPNLGLAKGGYVEDLTPDWYRDHMLSTCRQALDVGKPVFQMVRMVYRYHVALSRRLILPVSRLGNKVDVLFVAARRTRKLADFVAVARLFG